MNQQLTTGIILRRTDYGEADRIITLLTPDHGKLTLIAKGVRRVKSKLAGGIELFSISQLTFIKGKRDVGTLVSARLDTYFSTIVTDIERTMLGYEFIKQLDKTTEDSPEEEYFTIMTEALQALNEPTIQLGLIRVWFAAQLLRQAGHSPNLQTDPTGQRLTVDSQYNFSFDDMSFTTQADGRFSVDHIKFLRLLFSGNQIEVLQRVRNATTLSAEVEVLVTTMARTYLRI